MKALLSNPTKPFGLGLGIDMPWGSNTGFNRLPDESGHLITARAKRFFSTYGQSFSYAFLAFQPKGRSSLRPEDYFAAYDEFFGHFPDHRARVFHHTLLNLGTAETYDRTSIYSFTNALAERYGFAWIVEDLGLWSLRGKTVPFPLPPFMTRLGLRACVKNILEAKANISVPISIEFPGFTEGTNFHVGCLDAFSYFAELANECGVHVTIDIGHILSYQWLLGKRQEDMLDQLELLPLDRCIEMHLSGCEIVNGKFRDLHHGILLNEQISMLEYLLPRCRQLLGVTYEDPRFEDDGRMIPRARENFDRLVEIVSTWRNENLTIESRSSEVRGLAKKKIVIEETLEPPAEDLSSALYDVVFKPRVRQLFLDGKQDHLFDSQIASCLDTIDREELQKTGRRLRQDLLGGNYEGSGGLRRSFPGVFSSIALASIPENQLMDDFFDSESFEAYTEVPFFKKGICIEEAFYTFLLSYRPFVNADPNNVLLLSHEFFYVLHAILAITRHPAFSIRTPLARRTSKASFSVLLLPGEILSRLAPGKVRATEECHPYLYAANSRGELICGPITSAIRERLEELSQDDDSSALHTGVESGADPISRHLTSMGLI
jgi:uncharacterized protein